MITVKRKFSFKCKCRVYDISEEENDLNKMARDNRVPMRLGEYSVMDSGSEFNNIRGRFDSEMQRMEDEMNKFRSELINKQADTFRKTSTR